MKFAARVAFFVACLALPAVAAFAAQQSTEPVPGPPALPRAASFTHLGVEQGLSDQQAFYALQDRSGFMWFGTRNGLDRFDGYTMLPFRHDPANPRSLSGNVVQRMYEDHLGTLWVSTWGTGVDAFDAHTQQFSHYHHDPASQRSLSSDLVSAFAEDQAGGLWLGTYGGGVSRFDRATDSFTAYRHSPDNPRSLSNDIVTALAVDNSGAVWFGTADGLDRFDVASDSFAAYHHDPADPSSLADGNVVDILQDRAGALWIATQGGGLDRFEPARGAFTHYRHDPNDSRSLSNDRLGCLAEDRAGALWVATWGGGLSVLDPARKSFVTYQHDSTIPASLGSDFVACVRIDSAGLLWAAGLGGVDLFNPRKQAFVAYRSDSDEAATAATTLASDNVYAVHEDRRGVLWIGTQDRGLDRFDRPTGRVIHYPPNPAEPDSLGDAWVSAIDDDSTGALWVGTSGGGLYRLDPSTGVFTPNRHDARRPDSLSNDFINAIHVDETTGDMWLGTNSGGVDRFDPGQGTFTHYRHDPANPQTLSSDSIQSLDEDQFGRIWIGTWGGGLNRLDPDTGVVTRFQHDPGVAGSLVYDFVSTVYIDRADQVWIGTWAGLDHFDSANNDFVHYRENDGLASDSVESILEDGAKSSSLPGNLWIATGRGLSEFDRRSATLRVFGATDGLPPGTDFSPGAYTSRTGELLFGSVVGLIAFSPDAVEGDTSIPPVVVTNFLLANKPVPISDTTPLHQSIDQTQQLELDYTNRAIAFEFAALSYGAPRQNRYRYMLEGFDVDWTEVDSTRRLATYTNLDPGTYVFQVTGSNDDGLWNPTPRAITLVITPAWWMSWWFRGLVIVLLGALGCVAYFWRINNMHVQQLRLEALVAERTRALESLLETRDVFLRTLAHDLKTPLAGLGWQVQLLQRRAAEGRLDPPYLADGLQAVAAGAAEAVSAIDELHDLTRLAAGATVPLHREVVDMAVLARQVLTTGSMTGPEALRLESPDAPLLVDGDSARLSRVLSNLVENAAKYSPRGDDIIVRLNREESGDRAWAVLRVIDHGLGIPAADLPHIFERYRRGSNVGSIDGEGLGLASVRQLIELHGGRLSMDSQPGRGTTVTVWLPLV